MAKRRDKSTVTSVRLLPGEREVINQMAEDRGLTPSEFIRALLRQTLIEDMESGESSK